MNISQHGDADEFVFSTTENMIGDLIKGLLDLGLDVSDPSTNTTTFSDGEVEQFDPNPDYASND